MNGVPNLPGPFWLIGCGNMAGAMLDGWLAAGLDPSPVTVVRPSGKPVADGVRVATELPRAEIPSIVMLGVKPQKLADVAPALAPLLSPDTLLISILAGARVETLRSLFPTPRTLVRAMPNLPVRLRQGVTGLHADGDDEEGKRQAGALMQALGLAVWLEDEDLLDVLTVIGGSGPAFVYRFIDALAAAGEAQGLSADQARRIAIATAKGAAALAAASTDSPGALADKVASPGGSTRAGLDILDDGQALQLLVGRTTEAALRRNREMAAEARSASGG